jgi:hypothetical protein
MKLDVCEICANKTKIMFVCPICNKTLCYEHRKRERHDCEHLFEENMYQSYDVKFDNDISDLKFDNDPNESESYQKETPYINSNNINELFHDVFDDKTITDEVKEFFNKHEEEDNADDEEKLIELKDEKENSIDGFKIQRSKLNIILVVFITVILLSITYLTLNGYLYSILNNGKSVTLEEYTVLEEKYRLTEENYNELYMRYTELETEYTLMQESYGDLEEVYQETIEFGEEIKLEPLKQITIPSDSNAVFYYEIPAPGYITVKFYSDIEIYSMVGSTMFEEVYYSKNPIGGKSSEYNFSVPVIPDLNIIFVNDNRDKSATVIFTIDYFYLDNS